MTVTEKQTLIFIGVLLVVGLLSAIIAPVSAEYNTTQTNATVFYNQTPLPSPTPFVGTMSIANGQCVPLNSTVDISSIGWGVPRISYYGRWFDAFSPGNGLSPERNITLPNTVSGLSKFYIDPLVFGTSMGYWYQDYDDSLEENAGNLRMFFVNDTCPNNPEPTNYEINFNVVNSTIPEKLPYLESKRESDILVARGDSVTIREFTPLHWWLFGYQPQNFKYDVEATNNEITISKNDLDGLSTGNYELILVWPGQNNIQEEYYTPEYKPQMYSNITYPVIESPFRTVGPIKIEPDPQLTKAKLIGAVKNSIDDNMTILKLQYQEPTIDIRRIDGVRNQFNDTFYEVRGYTNVANGTKLTIYIDKSKINAKNEKLRTYTTEAIGLLNDTGEWRQFNEIIPLDYTQIFPGAHQMTITSESGAIQTVDFYIYKELPGHYQQPEYVEYVGASPYITPKVVEKVVTVTVPPVVQTVVVHDTPSDAQVYEQQKKIDAERWGGYMDLLKWAFVGIAFVALLGYAGMVVYRGRKRE